MTDRGDTYGGIFWVRATDGGWHSATPAESCDEIKRLRAENARLQEALDEIAFALKGCIRIAREALEMKP
jgi:hypothetical protein